MWAVLMALAAAEPLGAAPAGVTAVTVLVCPDEDGCPDALRVYDAHCARVGLPLLSFEPVAGAALGGADALLLWQEADPVARFDTLGALPFTVRRGDLLALLLEVADTEPTLGDRALAMAASSSRRQSWNLPPMSEATLARYLDAVAEVPVEPAALSVTADAPGARVFVDGEEVGHAPVRVTVPPGWHRVTVERPGHRTAFVATVEPRSGEVHEIAAPLAPDDGANALRSAVLGEMHGVRAPAEVPDRLSTWARESGLRWVRFVAPGAGAEEVVDGLSLGAVYLDVPRGRFTTRGPGPAALRLAADRERFRVGASVGWWHLGSREHLAVELIGDLRLSERVAADVRLGVAHGAEPYNLYPRWVDRQVYPVSLGARIGGTGPGPWVAPAALIVVPYAVGGQVIAGFDVAPSPVQRLSFEAKLGLTDRGLTAGVGLALGRRY